MKILVIGELCTDRFIYGKVSKLCPEAPVPVFNPVRTTTNPGMAGNVVENIKAMRPDANIAFWHQHENITKERVVEEKSNQMIVRIDDGELKPITDIGYLSPERREIIRESDLVIVSDYNKGFLSENSLREIADLAIISVLDTKKKISEKVVDAFTFVKLNEPESILNSEISHKDNVIVTLGSKGARIGEKLYAQRNPKETIDVSGAGDTFVAAFAIHYAETQHVEDSLMYANEMAGIVVGKRGVATP